MPWSEAQERIVQVVLRIPEGRVATYGQVAELAGLPGRARLAGKTMASLDERPLGDGGEDAPGGAQEGPPEDVPWHRVLNARGAVSQRADGGPGADHQRWLLEQEGVRFRGERVDLKRHLWRPRLVLDSD
ncbi:MAG: MGMT family protein [Acidobacteriota bacterium]